MTPAALRADARTSADRPLAVRLGEAVAGTSAETMPEAAGEKLRLCLLDFLACAFEASSLPWARQAALLATPGAGPCTIVGTPQGVPAGDAVFANAVAGHGLVREDMHTGSVSHLGIVVLPPLLALAQERRIDGRTFTAAAVVGYEVGGRIGRALVTPEFARTFRPTGFTGPLAAAAAVSHALGFDAAQAASALSLAANLAGGLNQWPHSGADEMFFEAGAAARSGFTAARLAMLGAHGSEGALDGEAGLLPAYRPDRQAPDIRLFDGAPEILSVFFKPVPVCNFAQTPCLAAIALARRERIDPADIASVEVKVTRAAQAYPGCDHAGPYARVLQAKMSIHFAVASALLRGAVDESSYKRLDDPALMELAGRIKVEADPAFTAAFPQKQGAEVSIGMRDGRVLSHRLADVVPADVDLIRTRFRSAAAAVVGAGPAQELEAAVDGLDGASDVGAVMRLTAARS
ncbi:MmgE/PrpD family protein [Labrys wisconsinensis]|uniref:2-methylcitrate dehydratase PrpD n=1 Tax=Labrys wisconsinensis TaxID=425677 RepID=A0ABU0JII2_9HYPH|nr:MmgE/PrpD family protein [Labrys wisconsinensis]MDQ0473233.1 2-methylcitrate dehydratase PrpD [Labrys wisconsinensis]